MEVKRIRRFFMNFNDVPEAGATRNYSIFGDKGAKFILIIADSTGKYYDFTTRSFSLGHTPSKILKGTIASEKYNGFISFPEVAGANYDIILIADPSDNTEVNKGVINKRLVQLGNVTVTFQLASSSKSSSYETLPSGVQSTNNPSIVGSIAVPVSFDFENKNNDTNGFGLTTIFNTALTNLTLNDKAVYFEKQHTVNGAVSSSNTIVLDSVDDIIADMVIVAGTGLSGTPVVRTVNVETKTITISSNQSFSDGITLTFYARGLSKVNEVLNCNIQPSLRFHVITVPTSTVRGAVSNSTTITLNGTYGIPGGDIAVYSGSGVNNSSTNTVTRIVTASETEGSMLVTLAQTFKGGEILTFSHKDQTSLDLFLFDTARIDGSFVIAKYPNQNRTIKIDLDIIITPGEAI